MKKCMLGALVAIALLTAGCTGPFRLTTKVHDWNRGISGDWMEEVVFLCLNIIPVYGVSVFVDAIVLNSIEFWTGDALITKVDDATTSVVVDGVAYTSTKVDDATFALSRGDQQLGTLVIEGSLVKVIAPDGSMKTFLRNS